MCQAYFDMHKSCVIGFFHFYDPLFGISLFDYYHLQASTNR